MGGPPLEEGMTLVAQMPHGPAQFVVVALTDEVVTADFNPPMAGKSLTFSVEVVELPRSFGRRVGTRSCPWAWRRTALNLGES